MWALRIIVCALAGQVQGAMTEAPRAPAGPAPVIIGMAAARPGIWFGVDPGPEFVAAYKNMSWAEELDVPLDVFRDLALKAKLIGKGGKGGWGRRTKTALIKLGITFYDTFYGKNTTTHQPIQWACAGAAPCHTPLDQIEGNLQDNKVAADTAAHHERRRRKKRAQRGRRDSAGEAVRAVST
ncbi:hypothetical protein M885DRAFT_626719 [Pelagophyceae sp. CCMP2097]|nr:hypothetical protein M885DRAFT_626719 [Pelagophyceae sp. CCMP2097]